jgi:hypothetical protein
MIESEQIDETNPDSFFHRDVINREERHLAAILFHLLATRDEAYPFDSGSAICSV